MKGQSVLVRFYPISREEWDAITEASGGQKFSTPRDQYLAVRDSHGFLHFVRRDDVVEATESFK